MVELAYSYLQMIIERMVQTDPRFKIIHRPIQDIIFFFQNLFMCLVKEWMQIYPNDFFTFDDSIHTDHLKNVVHKIQDQYDTSSLNFPFILDFFKDALRLCKNNLSSPLYEKLLLMSLARERKQRLVHHPTSNKLAVIFDPRYDPLMEAVIRNFMHFLNKHGWNLMIFSHASHKDQITADFPTCLFSPIDNHWMVEGQISITTNTYNKIFTTKSFWQSIPAQHILIFQKDCAMYKMFDESLFLSYDFAGANFYDPIGKSFMNGGINGGFSLRNKDAMIDCIERVSWDDIIEYNKMMRNHMHDFLISRGVSSPVKPEYDLKTFHEDIFFVNACEILRKKIPDIVLRDHLAIEVSSISHYPYHTCVYHGWNKNFQDLSIAKTILEKSPFFFPYLHNIID